MVHRKYIFRRGLAILLSMAMVSSLMTPWTALAAGEDIQLYTTSTFTEVHPGDEITVEVKMSTQSAFTTGSVAFWYDTSKLQYSDCVLEDAFNPTGMSMPIVDENTGFISTALVTDAGYDPFPTGDDKLVETLTFTVSPGTEGDIDFTFKDNGDFTTEDGTSCTLGTEDRTAITATYVPNPATSVTISPKTLTLQKDDEAQQLTATTTTENGEPTSDKVVWSSDNDEIAKVDQNGYVTPIGGGTTTIKATAGAFSDTCQVTVESPLESISLNKNSASILKGATTDLTVSYNPTDTTVEKNVSWSVTNGDETAVSIASSQENSSTATITGLHEGTATVTATVDGKSASCDVTVKEIKLEGIQVNPTSESIAVGGKTTLGVTYNPSNTTDDKTVKWSSDYPNIANVDDNGTVTGISPGKATITAQVGEFTSTSEITVTHKKTIVTFPTEADLTYGQTLGEATFVGGSATDSEGNSVEGTFTFSSEAQQAIPSVSNSGSSYEVTFTPNDSSYESATAYVPIQVAKKAITVTADDKEMTYQNSVPEFTFTVPDGALVGADTKDALGLTLTAYDSAGAEVSSNTSAGTYSIVQKSCTSANYDVTVTPGTLTIHKLTPVCTFPTSAQVTTGQKLEEATFVGGTGEGTFAFADATHVVTVDDIGKSYDVVFTPSNEVDYETVTQPVALDVTVPLESISIDPSEVYLQPNKTQQLSVKYNPEQTTVDKSVSWESDDKDVATVSDSGLVTAISEGQANITAKVAGATATCTVTVKEATVDSVNITSGENGVMQGVSAQYTAEVLGTDLPDTSVKWVITGNSSANTIISDRGVLTVGTDETATTIQVIAQSVMDATKQDQMTVTIYQRGDFTHDGRVDTLDKKRLLEAMNDPSSLDENSMAFKEFDLTHDGKIDQEDLNTFLSILALID